MAKSKECGDDVNAIERYFAYRQSLIDQYVKGDLTKSEYLDQNLLAVLSLNIKPFKNIDTLEKGLFNYQYYNAMAKDAKSQGKPQEVIHYFYDRKDAATMRVLTILDYRDVSAYFIRVRSKQLKRRLFEMTIPDYHMILHSTSERILAKLRSEGVFHEEVRESVIDGYINQKY